MLKCPFCSFDNEEGALFCEQCKSDLSAVPSSEPTREVPVAAYVDDTVPVVPMEAVQMADVPVAEAIPVDETIPMAEPAPTEAIPVAEAMPMEAIPEEAIPAPAPLPQMAPPIPEIPIAAAASVAAAPEPPAPPPAPAAAPAAPAAPAAAGSAIPPGSQPKLIVIRGQKLNVEFPIYPDLNFIGRADDKPVDVDLEDQEPPDRVWSSRQHAVLQWDEGSGTLTVEDLNSSNGTFVNRVRLSPGAKKQIYINDVIQIGTVHLKVKV